MKKTFLLTSATQADARVRDKVRHEVNKYVKRERKKEVPEGFFRWDFNCKIGASEEVAEDTTVDEIAVGIDTVAETGAPKVYLQIEAFAVRRSERK
jgi:hypothetical protein